MDCRGDARKLHPGLRGMMHKGLGWMSEGGVHPQHFSKATEAVIPSASPVQGDASVLWLKLFQTQKCPRDLFVIPAHSGLALGASSSLVARGMDGSAPAGPSLLLHPCLWFTYFFECLSS